MINNMFSELFTVENQSEFKEKTKVCNKCKNTLSISKFAKDCAGGNKFRSQCKECTRKLKAELVRLRKITPPPSADHTCPICKRNEAKIKAEMQYMTRKMSVWSCDHDHSTKEFRGWICNKCNLGLGNFNDNVDFLRNCITYLEKK